MNKWLKILSGIGAVLILLVVALLVLATVLITPERVKETILPLAEENLQRKIELGDIEVSLLSGIEIHGLKLYEKNGKDLFVSTDMVRLKYQLLPLLAMKVVIDEVRLEKPNIRVVRLKDGQFNYSDLIDGADSETTPEKTQPQPQQGSESASSESDLPLSLLVSNLLLQDGHLVFIDHVLNDKAPYRYEISGLQVAAKGVTLTGKIPLSVQCQLNESPLTLDGHINLQPFSVDFDIAMKASGCCRIQPLFQGKSARQSGWGETFSQINPARNLRRFGSERLRISGGPGSAPGRHAGSASGKCRSECRLRPSDGS